MKVKGSCRWAKLTRFSTSNMKKKKMIEEIEIFSRKLERENEIQESVGFSL